MSVLRQLLILIVGGAAVTGAWLWYAEAVLTAGKPPATPSAAPLPIEVARVVQRPVRSLVEAVGTTRASQSVDVVAAVSGRIAEIHFEAGQRINRGDPLVSLDDAPERAAVAEAKALLEEARLHFERGRQLAEKETMAQARIDELRAQYLVAEARLDNALSRLSDREVLAPFDGVVGLRNVSLGAWVDDETVITTLDALTPLEIEFSVPEIFFSEIGPGTPVLAASDAFPDRDIHGGVRTVDSRIDPVTRSFRVRAEIDNPGALLPAGLFATVTIILKQHVGLLVPEQAVVTEGRSSFVFRIEDNVARRVTIRLGQRVFGEVEVLEGLAEGDLVATTGLQRLQDGAPVAPGPAGASATAD